MKLIATTIASILIAVPALAGDKTPNVNISHGLTLLENLKYPPDFRHFDYVNPNAPKGGVLRRFSIGTFDSFNP